MKLTKKRIKPCYPALAGITALSALAMTAQGAITIHAPTAFSGNSQFNATTYQVSNLFDATITEATLDQTAALTDANTSPLFGRPWAVAEQGGKAVLVMDFSTSITFDGLLYVQRTFSSNNNSSDYSPAVNVWVTNTDPGTATLTLPGTLGPAQDNLPLDLSTPAALRAYAFDTSLTGRYVVMEFQERENFVGGHELRLYTGTIPEPTTAAFTGLTALLGLGRRRRATV